MVSWFYCDPLLDVCGLFVWVCDALWNDYRHAQCCIAPVPVITSVGPYQYSLGDKDRFAQHQADMLAFLRSPLFCPLGAGLIHGMTPIQNP